MLLNQTYFCSHSACPASFGELLHPPRSTHASCLQIVSVTLQLTYPSMDYSSSFPCTPWFLLRSGNYIQVSMKAFYFSRTQHQYSSFHGTTGMCTSITAGANNEQVRWNVPGDPHRLALSVLTQQHAHTKLGNSHSCMLLCRAPIPSNGQFPECGLCILSFQLPDLCHQTCCSNKQTVMKKNCSNNNVLKQIKQNWAQVSQECRGK